MAAVRMGTRRAVLDVDHHSHKVADYQAVITANVSDLKLLGVGCPVQVIVGPRRRR